MWTNLEEKQAKLILGIYKEVYIAREKNLNNIHNIEFEIALSVRVWHLHQESFLQHNLEGYVKNQKLIDKLCKLMIEFESNGANKIIEKTTE